MKKLNPISSEKLIKILKNLLKYSKLNSKATKGEHSLKKNYGKVIKEESIEADIKPPFKSQILAGLKKKLEWDSFIVSLSTAIPIKDAVSQFRQEFGYYPVVGIAAGENGKMVGGRKTNKKDNKLLFDLIKELRAEVSKLIPAGELNQGRLVDWRLSKYLGLSKIDLRSNTIQGKLKYLKKNPDAQFSKDEINAAKKSVKKFFGDKALDLLEILRLYEQKNVLKQYSNEQHNVKNPNVFKKIDDPEISFWYGLLGADGSLMKRQYKKGSQYSPKYILWLELQEQDKILVEQFRDFIGLDRGPDSIKTRTREWSHFGYKFSSTTSYLRFTCKPMGQDLENLGFASSKAERKDMPDFDKHLRGKHEVERREVMLAWLLGYYCGDGISETTQIVAASKEFLLQMKETFNIKQNVIKVKDKSSYINIEGDEVQINALFSLAIGAKLFNEMWEVGRKYNLGLERKYKKYVGQESTSYEELINILDHLHINKEVLQEMVYELKQFEILKILGISKGLFRKLRIAWDINLPQKGYWTKNENKLLR